MSCPNWQALVGEAGGRESEAWVSALGHLEQCSDCRPGALAADPLLMFRRLPTADLDEAEVDDLRERVRIARRVQRVTDRGRSPSRWREAVAAAVLLVAAGWVGGGSRAPEPLETVGVSTVPSAASAHHGPTFSIQEAVSSTHLDGASMPLFEEIGEPYQQVVQWSDESLSVVLVVDERFDV